MVRVTDSLISLSDFSLLSNKMSTSRYISHEVLSPKESLSRPQPQGILQPQQVGLLQAPFKSLFFCPGFQCIWDFVCSYKSGVSVSPSPIKLLWSRPAGHQMLWGLLFLMSDSLRIGSLMGSEISLLWENFCDVIILQFVGCLPVQGGGYAIYFIVMCPSFHLFVISSLSLDVDYLLW